MQYSKKPNTLFFLLTITTLAFLVSCKKPKYPSTDALSVIETIEQCYIGIIDRDTIKLEFKTVGDSISGLLSYSYFNKFQNSGIIKGVMHGDTLFAVYTITSNDGVSQNEVAFIKQNNVIYEGSGDVIVENGMKVFVHRHALIFSTLMKLEPTHCQ